MLLSRLIRYGLDWRCHRPQFRYLHVPRRLGHLRSHSRNGRFGAGQFRASVAQSLGPWNRVALCAVDRALGPYKDEGSEAWGSAFAGGGDGVGETAGVFWVVSAAVSALKGFICVIGMVGLWRVLSGWSVFTLGPGYWRLEDEILSGTLIGRRREGRGGACPNGTVNLLHSPPVFVHWSSSLENAYI